MATTAAVVAQCLAERGIARVFGLPGGEVLVLIDELRKAGIDFVLMRHEANAGLAAAVYGKLPLGLCRSEIGFADVGWSALTGGSIPLCALMVGRPALRVKRG